MVCPNISFGKVYCQSDWRCHWSSGHRTGYISHNQSICSLFYVIWECFPLCFKNFIVLSSVNDFFNDVIRIQSWSVDFNFSFISLINKIIKSIWIMFCKSSAINHHCTARNFWIFNLIPFTGRHKAFNNTDLFSHTTNNPFEVVDWITQLLCSQDS